jgi:hypothetical protein
MQRLQLRNPEEEYESPFSILRLSSLGFRIFCLHIEITIFLSAGKI